MSELYKNADKRYLVFSAKKRLYQDIVEPIDLPGLLGSYSSVKEALANHFDETGLLIVYDRIAGIKIDLKRYPRPEPQHETRSHHRPRYGRGWPFY